MAASLIVLAVILGAVATTLAAPFLIALYFGETQNALMLGSCAAAYAFLASAIFITLRGTEARLKRVQTFALLIQSWLLLLIAGAIPLWLVTGFDISIVAFEAVSAITTSNASIFGPPEAQSRAVLFWRSQLQWLGGLLTLLSIVVVLAPAGVGGLPRRQIALLERVGTDGGERIIKVCLNTGTSYVGLSVLATALLAASGVPVFDSICLAAAVISTGGLMPVSSGLASYEAPFALPILTLFMAIGATSILWHRMVFFRRGQLLREHRESYYFLGVCIALGLIVFASLVRFQQAAQEPIRWLNALGEGLFVAVSLLSTTGLSWEEGSLWILPPIAIGGIVLVGGGAFSTAGGLKLYRLGGMLVQSFHEINRLVFPHSVQSQRFGANQTDISVLKAIWSLLIAAILLIWGTAGILALQEVPFEAALLASIAAFSSIGTAYDPALNDFGTWPSYAAMSGVSQAALGFTMLLGRLEVLAFFGLFNITYWNAR